MKKIWMAAGLAALLIMAGCGQGKTAQSYIGQTSPSSSESEETSPAEQDNAQNGQQESSEAADPIVLNPFYTFEVEGIHSVTEDGIVIIGHVQEGNIQTGATASVLTADGAFYESSVKQIEIFDDQAGISTIVEWAGKDITVRVLLEGLEEAEISAGDTMTGYLAVED